MRGLLGLCAVVMGLMALNTGMASATVGANWLILTGAKNEKGELIVKTGAELHAAVGLEKETTGVLHTKILGFTVLYECEKIEAINANLLANGSIGKELNGEGKPVGAQIRFSECITRLNGEINESCKPNAGGTESGVIKTTTGHGLIVLHEPKAGEKVELTSILPDTGETFAIIESTKACPIGIKVPVIGKATLKDCEGLFLKHLLKHLVEIGPLTELWTISKTEEHVATILGSAWAFLLTPHNGMLWGGDPA
jgi:hypothetical protein